MKNIRTAFYVLMIMGMYSFLVHTEPDIVAQEEEFLDEEELGQELDGKKLEEDRKKREEEEKRKQEEEALKAKEAERSAIRKRELKARKKEEARQREMDAIRESMADTTEYTIDPSSVELVVELDPNNYGFRTRSHRMTMTADIDLLLRGRSVLHYDYRFFNNLSLGILAGIDWTDISLYSRFRDDAAKRSPKQLTLLGGLSAKWRVTEWYMKSAFFLEPSLLFGHMWQTLHDVKSTHWRLRPGLFGGIETVFDSGLAISTRLGVEFPFDFGAVNPIREVAEPLLVMSFGFAL